MDKSPFSLKLLRKGGNVKKQKQKKKNDELNGKLNPNAAEFKVEESSSNSLNPQAKEFRIEMNTSKLNPTASVFTPKPATAQFNSLQSQQMVNNILMQHQQSAMNVNLRNVQRNSHLSQSMVNLNAISSYRANMVNNTIPPRLNHMSPHRMNGTRQMDVNMNVNMNQSHSPIKSNNMNRITRAHGKKANGKEIGVQHKQQQPLAYPAWSNISFNSQSTQKRKFENQSM